MSTCAHGKWPLYFSFGSDASDPQGNDAVAAASNFVVQADLLPKVLEVRSGHRL